MLEIILGVIVLISILLIMIIIINNKFQFSIIKIDKAEEDISLYLDKKKELLDRCRPTIKKELKLESFLDELDDEDIVDIKYGVSISMFAEEQIYCFSAMVLYK